MVKRYGVVAFLLVLLSLLVSAILGAQTPAWPNVWTPWGGATWRINVTKTAGMEMSDPFWGHLHAGMPDAQAVTFGVGINDIRQQWRDLAQVTDIQVRYLVKGTPVSGWLSTPFAFVLTIDNPSLPALDGIFDVSVDVQGATRGDYTFTPMFLHLYRGRAVDPHVPICSRDVQYDDHGEVQGPICRYVTYADMVRKGRPADPNVTPWHGPTNAEPGLFQEELAPHTNLFTSQQMWWEEPYDGPSAGLKFVRALVPKWDEDHRGLRPNQHQDRFPFIDGPRGISWGSTYVMGQIDSHGNFCHVEAGGPLRCLSPEGTYTTKVGWHVAPGKEPVWVLKTLDQVRHNEVFEGVFTNGRYADGDGFRTPLDLAIDPKNESIYYVAGYDDNAIWRADCSVSPCAVSVFAGDVNHGAGFSDGNNVNARFSGPASLVFDPVCDCLYVADQNNDAIRKITRAGVVTTLFGTPGQDARQVLRGVTSTDRYQIQGLNRTAAGCHYAGVRNGCTLETYLPQAVRVDSQGNLILLDIGFGAIRRVNPATLEATHLAHVGQRFEANDEGAPGQGITGSTRGFAFLDVDRWGNAGELDAIYFGAFQGNNCDGEPAEHVNEAYCVMPKTGAPAHFVFPWVWDPLPDGWGPREATSPPHYYWLMQVDPRGALILGGGGEHGLTRLRKMRPTDPTFADENALRYYGDAKIPWKHGQAGDVTPLLRNGSEGHSYVGGPDAADYVTAPDAQILADFGLSAFPAADQAKLVNYLRLNGASWGTGTVQPEQPKVDCAGAWSAWAVMRDWYVINATTEGRDSQRTYSVTTPPQNGGAACPVSPETKTETRPRVQPVDPCVAQPLMVTVTQWPTKASGSRSLVWNSFSAPIASFSLTWTPSLRVTFTDSRGCAVTRVK